MMRPTCRRSQTSRVYLVFALVCVLFLCSMHVFLCNWKLPAKMQRATRCGWALGAPSLRVSPLSPCWLTQPTRLHGAHTSSCKPLQPARHLHKTLAVRAAQQQQQQQQQQRVIDSKQQLSWQELHRAAQIAAWSGLAYLLPDELGATIRAQHQGLTLVAAGRNGYTAWFVADGVVPAAHFCSTISNRSSSSSSSNGSPSSSGQYNTPRSSSSSNGSSSNYSSSNDSSAAPTDAADAVGGVCARVAQGTRERFVFFRGVQWAAPDINSTQLSQALMSLWPTPFPSSSSSSSSGGASQQASASPLVAHAGVAGIAQELFSQLRPYMQQADDVGMPLCFAGHSLGGSLAMLMLVQHQMHRRDKQQRPWPSCYTFGSPPVLAHSRGGGGPPVLDALALPHDALSSFVLEMDPVPRALLSVDPTFQALSGWSAVKGLLQLRELFVGSGSPLSPGRFLFEAVGQVHLIKWTPEGGSRVVPLDATEIEQELSYFSPAKPAAGSSSSNGSNGGGSNGGGNGQQPVAAAMPSATAAPGGLVQQQEEQQSPAGMGAAAAAGGALMSSLRAWLDHHHRSYAQELEAAALRGVREQLAAEQRQQQQQQQ